MSAPASQQVETLWTKNEVAAFLREVGELGQPQPPPPAAAVSHRR
jgi:hypothetical protein